MPKKLPKGAERMADILGVSPSIIDNQIIDSARIAAEEIQSVLQRMLDDLDKSSESGALQGYKAVLADATQGSVILSKSGVTFDKYSYIVYVKESPWHGRMDPPLNVFDILDQGRDPLPGGGPYPMWGVGGNRLPQGGGRVGGRFSVADQITKDGAVRTEPRSPGQRAVSSETRSLRFAMGPIAGVEPKDLYKRALKIAKRRVGSAVPKHVWDLVYVPDRERWIKDG